MLVLWSFVPRDFCCSKGNVEDKILVPKLPKNCARCAKCGHSVNGPYCQGCTLLQEKLEENLVTYFQNFQNTSESSDDSTNIVNAPREPVVVKQDHESFVNKIIHTFASNQCHCFQCKDVLRDDETCQRCTCTRCGSGLRKGLCYICGNNQNSSNDSPSISANSSQNPPHIDKCCYECGEALDGIFCQQCTLPFLSKPNFVDESSNIFNPPPQPPIYSCEFCRSNAQYGYYCTPQAPFINPEPVDRFDNNISFEEEVEHQRLRKTLTHVLELSSCIYLDDRAWRVLNFDSAGMRYPVDTSLIHIDSRKSPTAELFDVDSGRISIHHLEY
uniref:Uncharacterized protein n=1 Tax=Tanacetum cinerariifolium TaxID=118510 RepID=A0A699JT85_TANCI|nr:hypothetical protein [Tanacetum cinerariifolium]